MKTFFLVTVLLIHLYAYEQVPVENYAEDPASVEHPGVPKGEVMRFTFEHSAIFPGTWREYWVYVPAQYRPDQPACVYVNQDGIQWKAPTVFDNLIHSKEIPVTIGVFVMHGRVRSNRGDSALDRFNRSFEYDGLGDAYARFILTEILPEVEKKQTADGRAIRLSHSGNDRAIGGSSSGAVCAFTSAWEHPEAFSRIFSAIGTYVGLRGADHYPTLIRKSEPRPLRIFLQDGTNDLNISAGDWWKANETMERAFQFSGYEVEHVWGEGAHNGKQGTALFPQAMRWLWKGWPAPVKKGNSKSQVLSEILMPGEDWQLVGEGYGFTEGTAANAAGEVFFQDIPNSKTYQVDANGKPAALRLYAKKASSTAFDAAGNRYTVAGETRQIIRYDRSGKETVVADSIRGNDFVVARNGNMYVTSPDGSDKPSIIYLVTPDGKKKVVDEGLKFANGIALTPDQTQLYITESASHWVWVYQVQPDGSLAYKQRYGWLHVPDRAENAWADGLKCDTAGRVYVTTNMGIQILDQTGRVNAIMPVPVTPGTQTSNLCFGGPGFSTLYVSCGDKVYRRKLRTRGANNFDLPVKPVPPKL